MSMIDYLIGFQSW